MLAQKRQRCRLQGRAEIRVGVKVVNSRDAQRYLLVRKYGNTSKHADKQIPVNIDVG